MPMISQIKDKQAIARGTVWVLLRYSDGSEFCFQSTLNPAMLSQRGIALEEGKLPRIDKKYLHNNREVYRQFAYEGATITFWDGCHYTDDESRKLHDFM